MERCEQIEAVINILTGTCQTLQGALDEYDIQEDELTFTELSRIDEEIFCCERCNWWEEIHDQHETLGGEHVCSDCLEEGDE